MWVVYRTDTGWTSEDMRFERRDQAITFISLTEDPEMYAKRFEFEG